MSCLPPSRFSSAPCKGIAGNNNCIRLRISATQLLTGCSNRKYSQVTNIHGATGFPQFERHKHHQAPTWAVIVSDEEQGKMIETLVREIKEKFDGMNDGDTSPSAYDTAWVARIPSIDDPTKPHFPTTLSWILNNQLEDGSWGDPDYCFLYDRLVCTLSCVLTLKIWNTGHDNINKGLQYLNTNVGELDKQTISQITCGFEVAFPSMLNEAKAQGLDLPYDLPCLKGIINLRDKKVSRIPVEILHSVHNTLLYTLEALQEVVQWDKILQLQSPDGSFLSSPAATTVVYMKTGDKKCLEFLTNIVNKFGDCSPCQYPIDLLERIWTVDTIQRLGIDHHFQEEISNTLDYLFRNIGKQGVSWGRNNPVNDIDDTCMALRLLRLHGYPISPDVLEYFKDDNGKFICFPGESHHGVSDMFNLYRFSQIAFPGETILNEARSYSGLILQNVINNSQLYDKWSLRNSLNKEVERAIKYPWRMNFARLEVREYIDYYRPNDVWIAKTIYRMYCVNDPRYLELAKLDYRRLQAIYIKELNSTIEWWSDSWLKGPHAHAKKVSAKKIHFSISATLYEPEFSYSRIAYC